MRRSPLVHFVHHSKCARRMSALGHKQTLDDVQATSALPPKADMVRRSRDARFVPKADKVRCKLVMIRS
jgi:hypothetical protein